MRRLKYGLVTLISLMALPAGALTCAPPDMSPEDLVAANLESPSNRYDLAVVGRVVAITTDLSESETHGRTYVQLSLVGMFGATNAGGRGFVVTTPDSGWVSGYAFEEGADYFIPLAAAGPQGEVNFVGACDPVERLTDAEATAMELAGVAVDNGVEHTYPIEDGGGGSLATMIFLVVMGGLLFWTGRKRQASRRHLNATGSDPRPPRSPRL